MPDSEISIEPHSQPFTRPKQPRLYRTRICSHYCRDFSERKVCVLKKHERLTLQWRQARYRPLDLAGQFILEYQRHRSLTIRAMRLVRKLFEHIEVP